MPSSRISRATCTTVYEKPVSFIRLKKSRSAEPMYGAKNQEAAKPLSFFIVNGTYAQTSSCNARGRDAKL
jgi:hypothetical protein